MWRDNSGVDARGKEVYFVLTTSGESGEDHQRGLVLPPAEIAEIREAEQRLAANILGVKDVIFLGQPDGRWSRRWHFVIRLSMSSAACGPDRHQHGPGSGRSKIHLFHPDHRATALAVFDAIYPAAGTPCYVPQPDAGLPAHKVREVYFSGTRHPNTYVDITETIELKIQALLSHRSQLTEPERWLVRPQFASQRGEQIGCRYAEAFRRMDVPQ